MKNTLGPGTWIPLGVAVGCAVVALGIAFKTAWWASNVDTRLTALEGTTNTTAGDVKLILSRMPAASAATSCPAVTGAAYATTD